MSGKFTHSECPKCKGTGQVFYPTLWEDGLCPCPECNGGGVLYEYIPNSYPVGLLMNEFVCPNCGRTYGCPYERDCCPCDL